MKFLLLTVITIITLEALCCKAEVWSMDATDPAYPGMCVYERKPYPPGELTVKSRCIRLTCSENGWISGHSCVKQPPVSGCAKGGYVDRKGKFPECCMRKYKCTFENGTEYTMEAL